MQFYDISQELFGARVYPGDRAPVGKRIRSYEAGNTSQVTELAMNVHNGTHIDAPIHRIAGTAGIDAIPLEACIGACEVISILDRDRLLLTSAKRILLTDCETVDEETARLLVDKGVLLVGVYGQSIGTREVHHILLSASVVVLEGLNLAEVPTGSYMLAAQPINLAGCDGAPCRAVLWC